MAGVADAVTPVGSDAAALEMGGQLLARLRAAGLTMATAESCTGGLIAATLTAHPGSSDGVAGGFVTYSNEMKTRLLGVSAEMIARTGAVSAEVAAAMAAGALAACSADLTVAVTGIAGPGGGSAAKPVGLVFVGGARRGAGSTVWRRQFAGDRHEVRMQTVLAALELAGRLIDGTAWRGDTLPAG